MPDLASRLYGLFLSALMFCLGWILWTAFANSYAVRTELVTSGARTNAKVIKGWVDGSRKHKAFYLELEYTAGKQVIHSTQSVSERMLNDYRYSKTPLPLIYSRQQPEVARLAEALTPVAPIEWLLPVIVTCMPISTGIFGLFLVFRTTRRTRTH